MYIIGYFIMAVAKVLDIVLICYMWVVVARAVLSWVNPDPFNPIVRFIHNITEPVINPIRVRIPINFGGMDLSPIVVFAGIIFARTFVVNSLNQIALSLL
ncbi:MAG: YggT family protein [Deltaproteobacteria bacterium]|nr:YggT family protein [Deltaproteobacteria bacterium]